MDHDDIRSMIAAYALGALDELEENLVREHIITCEECTAEADGYLSVSDRLTATVADEEPPTRLADLVLKEVGRDRHAPEAAPRTSGLWLRLVAAGTTAAVIVLGVLFVDVRNDLRADREVLGLLVAGSDGIELAGDTGRARLLETESGSILVAAGLPAPPEDDVYQLWFLGEAEPVSAGVFGSSDDVIVFESELTIEGFEGAAVTFEPKGGSDQPTGPIVITSS